MKNKITLYTLAGCKNCENVRTALSNEGIAFSEVVCSDRSNDAPCDNIERIVDCQLYPIVKITNKVEKDSGGFFVYKDSHLIIHYCRTYDDTNTKKKLGDDYSSICVHSSLEMINTIIKNK